MDEKHVRQIDRWLKWMAVLGPMISGIVFGAVGYIGGYQRSVEEIKTHGSRLVLLESWKDRQDAFNLETVKAITRLKALMKEPQ